MAITIRVTPMQIAVLVPALRQVYINHTNFQHTGSLRDCHPDLPFSGGSRRFGHFNPVFMDVVIDIWKQVSKLKTSGGRIYNLDAFGVAACIFAVRTTLRMVRHGHHEQLGPRMDRSAKQFIAKLERERKRLKRSAKAEVGAQRYSQASREWKSFLKFLRYAHLYCRCSYRRRNNLYRIRRLILNDFCEIAATELKARGVAVPSNLRQRIRRQVRYIRRNRTSYSISDLRCDRVFAASRFANYIVYGSL
jgi:hypothetical protein